MFPKQYFGNGYFGVYFPPVDAAAASAVVLAPWPPIGGSSRSKTSKWLTQAIKEDDGIMQFIDSFMDKV
jgi:hypothetical protein